MTPLSAASHLLPFTMSRDGKTVKYSSASGGWNLSTSLSIFIIMKVDAHVRSLNKGIIISPINCFWVWERVGRKGQREKEHVSWSVCCVWLICVKSTSKPLFSAMNCFTRKTKTTVAIFVNQVVKLQEPLISVVFFKTLYCILISELPVSDMRYGHTSSLVCSFSPLRV